MARRGLDEVMGQIGERVLEQDDLLRTVWIVRRSDEATIPLFDRLTKVCLEQLFLELEFRHIVAELSDDDYLIEVARLVAQCRAVGVAPPAGLLAAIDEIDLTRLDDPAVGAESELDD